MIPFAPKPRACKHCGSMFTPARPLAYICSPICASRYVKALKVAEKKQIKERKERIKKTSKWEEECRTIVQAIARLRDRHDGCISCHLPASWGGQWHGSHFRSHGAASAVQFHLWNIHKACSSCNRDKGGNVIEYRPRLVEKIGQDRVDWLMAQNQTVRHDVDYYKRFKKVMGKRLRRMEKQCSAV